MTDQRRALLTEREQEILADEADVTDNYRYSVESRIRSRLRDRLPDDVEILMTHLPEVFDEVVYPAVCQPGPADEVQTPDTPTPEHTGDVEAGASDASPTSAEESHSAPSDVAESDDELPVVAAMSFDRDTTDRRLLVLEEWFAHVRDEETVQKSDFLDWYTEEHQKRTGYNAKSYWEFFAKPGLRQADAVEQPNSRTYRWVSGDA